jgi:hypothetical protein
VFIRQSSGGSRQQVPGRNLTMHEHRQSYRVVVRAEQRVVQEGSSPSGARMRGAISKSGGNSSLAEESRRYAHV